MKKNKKAQGISINTIVVAAIALVVMILLVVIFTQNARNFNIKANECLDDGQNEVCKQQCGEYEVKNSKDCYVNGEVSEDLVCCTRTR